MISPDAADRGLDETIGRLDPSRIELERSREEAVYRLSRALEMRDPDTGGHTDRIGATATVIARAMGMDRDGVELIRLASPMHDVGKIGVPDGILLKPASLTLDERGVIERHAEIGHRILAGSSSELMRLGATIALTHHERIDGTGYPRGLKGEAIPIEGRIVAVADVFDALTHDRVYRPAYPLEVAVGMMREGRSTHFDPDALDALLSHLDQVVAPKRARFPSATPN